MLKIYETVVRVLQDKYSNQSQDFKKGAKTAMNLIEVGIRKSNQFNLALQVKDLLEERRKLKTTIDNLRKEISIKEDKLFESSLVSSTPLRDFKEYEIPVKGHKQKIYIVTNMDYGTLSFCLLNFSQRHSYNRPDEAKSKLLTFINSKKHLGFIAFKDNKTYKKEYLNKKT